MNRDYWIGCRVTEEERELAKEIARELDISVSKLFARYIRSLARALGKIASNNRIPVDDVIDQVINER